MRFNRVALAVNSEKKESVIACSMLQQCFDLHEIISESVSIDFENLSKFQNELRSVCTHSDLLIVVGGDGSMLSAIPAILETGLPVMGINTGKVGFLAEFNYQNISEMFEKILEGNYRISTRQLLEVEVQFDDRTERYYALNDFILTRGVKIFKVIQYEARINGSAAIDFFGDGIIIATPTGSTAYNLSAGGPIMYPEGRGLMVTPICSHSLLIKPFIISDSQDITINTPDFDHTIMSVDGIFSISTQGVRSVHIKASEKTVKLMVRQNYNFFKLLFSKLK